MKYYVVRNSGSKFGFDFVVKNDNDEVEKIIEMKSKTTDGYLRIPAEYHDELGKKMIKMSLLNDDEIEIEKGKNQSIGKSHEPKMSELDFAKKYLSDDEYEMFTSLKKKIAIRMEIAKKKAEAERAQREYEELLSKLGE